MKKQYLLSYCFFALSFVIFSQKDQNDQLSVWINEHPNVIFIEENNLKNFSNDELAKFSGNYIVFNEEISIQDVLKYDPSFLDKVNQKPEAEIEISEERKQADDIKDWMAKNPHVKVVSQAEFNAQPIEIQREYTQNKCLILTGEKITVEDIKNYQY